MWKAQGRSGEERGEKGKGRRQTDNIEKVKEEREV